jgi:hypothetical protein
MATAREFAFTIGYDGSTAVVDSKALADNAGLDARTLLEKGQFRAAYALAIKLGDDAAITAIREAYNRLAGTSMTTRDEFSRLFGVYPQESPKVKRL